MIEPVIIAALFLVALLYSSVGHGGASGYLAVMALFSVSSTVTRPTALVLNVFVASIAFVQFYRAKSFDWGSFCLSRRHRFRWRTSAVGFNSPNRFTR